MAEGIVAALSPATTRSDAEIKQNTFLAASLRKDRCYNKVLFSKHNKTASTYIAYFGPQCFVNIKTSYNTHKQWVS